MAIFARKSKTNDGEKSSKKEQGSFFRAKKDAGTVKPDDSEVMVTSLPEPRASYAPSTTRSKMPRRTSSINTTSAQTIVPATPRATRNPDQFPRVDIQTVSDSPTLGHPRALASPKDRSHFQANQSDSGYESTDTHYLPHAFERGSAIGGKVPPFDSDSRSVKSSKSAASSFFHLKRAQKGNRLEPMSPLPHQKILTQSGHNPQETIHSQGLVLPPTSILAGLKVNTKGRILDEEGDVIGELFEGDLLDCVRQKANSAGEVLDDYGRVVGRVRTVPRSAGTPSVYATSPLSGPQRYSSNLVEERVPMSPLLLPAGPEPADAVPASQTESHEQDPSPAVAEHAEIESPQETRRGSEASIGALPILNNIPKDVSLSAMIAAEAGKGAASLVPESLPSPIETRRKMEKRTSSPSVTFANPDVSSKDVSTQERPKVPKRAETERIAPPFPRSQSRMSINSIVASRTPDEGRSNYTPSLFSYKGEIPAADGPQGSANPRQQPPFGYSNSRQGPPALNVKIAHVSSGAGQRRVQITDDLMGMPLTRPTLGVRSSASSTYKKSYLSSADVTPSESPEGTEHSASDDGRTPMTSNSSTPSLYAGRSAHTQSSATTRTYFTHAGRVAVPAGEEASSPPVPAASPLKPAEVVPQEKTEKKKGRFGLFGKK